MGSPDLPEDPQHHARDGESGAEAESPRERLFHVAGHAISFLASAAFPQNMASSRCVMASDFSRQSGSLLFRSSARRLHPCLTLVWSSRFSSVVAGWKSNRLAMSAGSTLLLSGDGGSQAALHEPGRGVDDLGCLPVRQGGGRDDPDDDQTGQELLNCAHDPFPCWNLLNLATMLLSPPMSRRVMTAIQPMPTASAGESCSRPASASASAPVITTTGRASAHGLPSIISSLRTVSAPVMTMGIVDLAISGTHQSCRPVFRADGVAEAGFRDTPRCSGRELHRLCGQEVALSLWHGQDRECDGRGGFDDDGGESLRHGNTFPGKFPTNRKPTNPVLIRSMFWIWTVVPACGAYTP